MTKRLPSLKSLPAFRRVQPRPPRLFVLRGWLFSLLRWPSTETTEWFCLRAALWWVLLLLPGLHLFDANPSFAGLQHWGAEGTWQRVMGAALVVQIVAVCLGNVWARVGALVAFGMIWAFVAGLFWAGSPHIAGIPRNTGVGLYSALAMDCFVVAIHLVRLWYIDHLTRQTYPLSAVPTSSRIPTSSRS